VAAGPGDAAAPVRLFGNGVWLGGRALRVDRTARALLDPLDPGARWTLSADDPTPLLTQKGHGTERLAQALDDVDSLVRREALFALVRARAQTDAELPEILPRLEDDDLDVRTFAAWAAGRTGTTAALPALVDCAASPNAALRRETARALVALGAGSDESAAAALRALENDPDPLVRAAAGGRAW
jgi:hypothetical protein